MLIFFLPKFLNSYTFKKSFIAFIQSKTDKNTECGDIIFSISPNLNLKGYFKRINITEKDDFNLTLNGLTFSLSPFNKGSHAKIFIENLQYKNIFLNDPNSDEGKSKFNPKILKPDFSKLPDIFIKKADLELGISGKSNYNIIITNLRLHNFLDTKSLRFNLGAKSRFFTSPIVITDDNTLYFSKTGLSSDNFMINFGKSGAILSGIIYDYVNGSDFNLIGINLPVKELEHAYLLISEQFNPRKNFIENFQNFSGNMDVFLDFDNKKIKGHAVIKDLRANTVLFNIPIYFKRAKFIFDGNDIHLSENALLGGEKTNVTFLLTGLYTDNVETFGSVSSTLGSEFAKKYIENLDIEERISLSVDYYIKNKVVDVVYQAILDKGSDISYSGAKLGLIDHKRLLTAVTEKRGDKITMTSYDYSAENNALLIKLIFGNAEFSRKNGRYSIDKITAQTLKDAPVSLLGFLENRLQGGFFNGNFIYDFNFKKFIGSIILSQSKFNGFIIQDAAIFGNDSILSVLADGTYKNEPFSAQIELENKFVKNLHIRKLDLFLKQFTMILNRRKNKELSPVNLDKTVNYYPDITIDNLSIRLDKFLRGNLIIENILIIGSVKNHIFDFSVPNVIFAGGNISAKGIVNLNKKRFKADITADNIDSNKVAYQIFNLKDTIEGKMNARLSLEGGKYVSTFVGKGSFSLKEGTLTKIKNHQLISEAKLKSNKLANFVFNRIKIKTDKINPYSNITGHFDLADRKLSNIRLYVQNNSVSFFIKGDYIPYNSNGNIDIWGAYDAEIAQNISFFNIPLSFVNKIICKKIIPDKKTLEIISKVPKINANGEFVKNILIKLEGDINNYKSLKVRLYRFE